MTGKVHVPVRVSVRPVYGRGKFKITGWIAVCPAHKIEMGISGKPTQTVVATRKERVTALNAAIQHIERWHS